MSEDDRLRAEEVNRLYWQSDVSVAEIAKRLGLSKRALYDALAPWPAERTRCPACGGELLYTTRSKRRAGETVCGDCGREWGLATLRQATAEAGPELRRSVGEAAVQPRTAQSAARGAPSPEPAGREAAPREPRAGARPDRPDGDRPRYLGLGLVAVAAAALGATVALLARRR